MNGNQQRGTGYVAALVARLGGDVIITDEEAARAGDLVIEHDRPSNQTRIRLKPVQLVGEIVTAPTQSIESGAHQCEPWQKIRNIDGGVYCGACGETITPAGDQPETVEFPHKLVDRLREHGLMKYLK